MPISFGCLVAGTHSGCGKTSVTLGLLRALSRRGLRLASFKSGPDFIDPLWHKAASGRTCRNLDTWMMPPAAVRESLVRHARKAHAVVVEGAMGLFDGRAGAESGSAAHLAKLCGLPVLLVLDATGAGRSLGAVALGFSRFDPNLRLAGIVVDKAGSARHARMVLDGLAAAVPDVPVLGWLPRSPAARLPSRHLGLTLAAEVDSAHAAIEALGELVAEHLDLDALARACALPVGWPDACPRPASPDARREFAEPRAQHPSSPLSPARPDADIHIAPDAPLAPPPPRRALARRVTVAVARDQAFCFCYPDFLEALARAGACLRFFSPLSGEAVPPDAHGVYLPGGYPELFAERLAANHGFLDGLRAHAQAGRVLYAECGGLMSLCRELVDHTGRSFPMAGVLSSVTRMHPTRQALGYREITLAADCVLGPAGTALRGHEFHYSGLDAAPQGFVDIYRATGADGSPSLAHGFSQGGVLASYVHVHPASCPGLGRAFAAACRQGGGDE